METTNLYLFLDCILYFFLIIYNLSFYKIFFQNIFNFKNDKALY